MGDSLKHLRWEVPTEKLVTSSLCLSHLSKPGLHLSFFTSIAIQHRMFKRVIKNSIQFLLIGCEHFT